VPRFAALLQLTMFVSSLAGPFLVEDHEANLPACCRRAGLHHCTLAQGGTDAGPAFAAARCPSYPGPQGLPVRVKAGSFPSAQSAIPVAGAGMSVQAQSEIRYRISHSRARDSRGPPALLT